MIEDDVLALALEDSHRALDPALAKRVHAVAKSELAPSPDERVVDRGRAGLAGAWVPALLAVAVTVHTAEVVEVAAVVYGDDEATKAR